ncbi:MAG TPA: patatin-like phospholipase family protein [Anaerolineales bacterium]|nr:patatin-like phospholipase family protein [Anaerolineales bacterium]
MKAFVLSGGGNYGAIQAGALEALLAHGHQPDMLVGVSAGALNAAWMAGHPGQNGAQQLVRTWRDIAPRVFNPLTRLPALLRLARGNSSLLANDELLGFITRFIPSEARFADFSTPQLFVTAARLTDGALKVFGDDPHDLLLDGLMSSTALPPVFPPWQVDGIAYVDGGLISNLPVRVALERGAKEIIALQTCHPLLKEKIAPGNGIMAYIAQTMALMIKNQAEREFEAARWTRGARLHLIQLWPDRDPGFWVFDQAAELTATGRRITEAYLQGADLKQPNPIKTWLRQMLGRNARHAETGVQSRQLLPR